MFFSSKSSPVPFKKRFLYWGICFSLFSLFDAEEKMSACVQSKPIVKIMIIGDSAVGKTSLMVRYIEKKFDHRYKVTIGADFLTKEVEIDGQAVTLQIWDTAGQERFQSLGSAFYRGADACILVFDVTLQETFSHLTSWMEEFNIQAGKRDCVLIGNKIDLVDKRTVQERTAKGWCEKTGDNIRYFETSAKDNTHVEEAFLHVATAAVHHQRALEVPLELPTAIKFDRLVPKRQPSKQQCSC